MATNTPGPRLQRVRLLRAIPAYNEPAYYRPQRSCEGYVFTPVCHSGPQGASASVHAGIPPWEQSPPLGADLPPEQTPPSRWLLLQTIRILLECILVYGMFTLPNTETDTETDKNRLCRTVWRCSHCTDTTLPLSTVAICRDRCLCRCRAVVNAPK